MKGMDERLLNGLYTDRYELTMALAYWREGRAEEPAVFDTFFRKAPLDGGFAVFAGLGSLLEALEAFRYSDDDLAFLEKDGFPVDFLEYLASFRFRGALLAPPEGEVVFPLETVVRVEGGLLEAQILETMVLNVLNFQTLIATKAARCRRSAGERALSEFGLRRAQGLGGLWASRAACIGGCDTTSNMAAARRWNLAAAGTMAHSFIQSYDDELTAFRRFAAAHGDATVLLLDTYDTLRSGLPNAIRVAREMGECGQSLKAVRLDSGDLAYLARKVREGLDEAGLEKVGIFASNQLDEYVIQSLLRQDAPIDAFGIGTSLATGQPDAALDGVYKLSEAGGKVRMKTSETVAKATFPGRKAVTRYYDSDGMMLADAIHLTDEEPPDRMCHPYEPHSSLSLAGRENRPLLTEVVSDGRPVIDPVSVADAAKYAREAIGTLPAEHQRLENPHIYKVGLSPRLRDLRDDWLQQNRKAMES
jgi:nicotinate phosphoribosyltransferase